MDTTNQQLEQLVLNVQQYSPTKIRDKYKRQKLLTQIQQVILQSSQYQACHRKLHSQYIGKLGSHRFTECYADALSLTWLEFLQKIDNYTPQKGTVLNLFIFLLNKRFIDTNKQHSNLRRVTILGNRTLVVDESLNRPLRNQQSYPDNNASTYLDVIPAPVDESADSLPKQLIQILMEDTAGIFSGKYLKNHPEVSYRNIAIAKIKGKSWLEISQDLSQKIGTLNPFLKRSHSYFKPIIHEYIIGEFILSQPTKKLIIEDTNSKFIRRRMKTHLDINFQAVILHKIKKKSWQQVMDEVNQQVELKLLIYFYLDSISYFKDLFQNEFKLSI